MLVQEMESWLQVITSLWKVILMKWLVNEMVGWWNESWWKDMKGYINQMSSLWNGKLMK